MIKICCYCKKQFGDKMRLPPGLPAGSVSHGICKACTPRAEAELDAAIREYRIPDDAAIFKRNEPLYFFMLLLEEYEITDGRKP